MNKTNFNVSLDIHDIYSQFTLPIKKGDTTGRLTVTLMEGGKPYKITEDCYAVFAATNPNGGVLHNSCIIQNNKIVYDLTPNTVAVSSKLECEILLYGEGGELLISPRFTIIVYETVYSEEEVASSNEYSSLNMLISAANTIINEVSRKLDNGEFNGINGIDGQDGIAVQSVKQTTTSDEDGGTNIISITLSNGSVATFEVQNGKGVDLEIVRLI